MENTPKRRGVEGRCTIRSGVVLCTYVRSDIPSAGDGKHEDILNCIAISLSLKDKSQVYRLDMHSYTNSTSPRATSCSTTAYGVNDICPFSISSVVPLLRRRSAHASDKERKKKHTREVARAHNPPARARIPRGFYLVR